MPQITVVMPLYNKAKYVQRAIDSVLAQSFSNFELIVVDDGSTDASAQLVSSHCTDRRLHMVHQENAGPGAARNHGLALAQSEYVAFLDADDQWLPDFLSSQYKQLIAHPQCAAALCRFYVDYHGNLPVQDSVLHANRGVWQLLSETDFTMMNSILAAMTPNNMLWNRSVLQEYRGFYEHHCLFGEEQYLMINVLLNHKLFINDEVQHIYHQNNSDLTISRNTVRKSFRPLLLHPEYVRGNCPPGLRPNLEFYLNWLAFNECCGLIAVHNIKTIVHIRDLYPEMDKMFRWQYFKKYFKLKVRLPLYMILHRLFARV
ncbi:MAG: glycosyltransferase family 2 protein [Sedimentisphaerales bacterium]|nr:glycosyltransferase family 2 protein [Sedimentisphaerales bacterium]MBN2843018.1 glycosyltransferase family 2 protein [Sedimentisphaerales bacterium]